MTHPDYYSSLHDDVFFLFIVGAAVRGERRTLFEKSLAKTLNRVEQMSLGAVGTASVL